MASAQQEKVPVVWTVSASVAGAGSGVQSDLLTFRDFGVYGCTVITAVRAQNSFAAGYTSSLEKKSVAAQINALDSDMPADAIKIGTLASRDTVETVANYLDDYKGVVIYDLELESAGESLLGEAKDLLEERILPRVNLLVVNIEEACALTGAKINSLSEMSSVASQLLEKGSQAVLVTGGSYSEFPGKRFDLWSDGTREVWIEVEPIQTANNRGGGCVLSAVLAAAIAKGMTIEDALRLGKAYVTQGIRGSQAVGSGPGAVAHLGVPEELQDMPQLRSSMPSP